MDRQNSNELVSNWCNGQETSVLSLHVLKASMAYVNALMTQNAWADQSSRKKMNIRDMAALSVPPQWRLFDLECNLINKRTDEGRA